MPQGTYVPTGGTTYTHPWQIWCSTTSTNTTATTGDTWTYWCDTGTQATTATNVIWTTWTGTGTGSTFVHEPVRRVLTAEEIAESDARELRLRLLREKLERDRQAAADRARELLVANLSSLQLDQFYKLGAFVVEGKNGFRYRIRQGRMGNVDMVKPDGTIQHRLCAHPREDVPDFDTMLAQKLVLETDEDSFLKVANRHHVLTPDARVLEPLH